MKTRRIFSARTVAFLLAAAAALSILAGCSGGGTKKTAGAAGTTASTASTPSRDIVVASYNIHIGVGMDKIRDLDRIARILTSQKVDVAGIQEVDRFVTRTEKIDEFEELKKLTGMDGVFGKSIDFQGGDYGIAVLTTGEVLEHRHGLFPIGAESERRSYLLVRVRFRDGPTAWVANTHLGLNPKDRQVQVDTLLQATASLEGPVILLGDFNASPDATGDTVYASLSGKFLDAWNAAPIKSLMPMGHLDRPDGKTLDAPASFQGESFPADGPTKRIDFIWLNPRDRWTVRRCWVGAIQASDHLPLFATVNLN